MIASEPSLLQIKTVRRVLKIGADALMAALSLIVATLLHFDGAPPQDILSNLTWTVPLTTVAKLGAVLFAGDYLRLWRYTSLREAVVLAAAVSATTAAFTAGQLAGLLPLPLAVILTDGAFTLLGMSAVRGLRRIVDPLLEQYRANRTSVPSSNAHSRRVLILGAGRTAHSLLGDIRRHRSREWVVVGLLDDDENKHGERLHDHRVLGTTAQLEQVIRRLGVEHVIIAIPTAQKMVMRGFIARAQSCGVSVQAVPTLERLGRLGRSGVSGPVTLNDLIDSAEVKRSLLPRIRRAKTGQTVLVTGGGGYIGVHLVRKLLERGMHVRVLDNFVYGDHAIKPLLQHTSLDVMRGDISNIRDVVAAAKDVDAVIALAAIVGDPACGLNAEETLTLNYEATKILVEACNFYGVDRLLFASSCSVYGASQDELLNEQSPLNPVSLYARTRILSEEVIRERCGDVRATILRLATVFGLSPRMRFDLVVNTLTVRAVVDRKIQIFGGDQWRPFVHCADVADAFTAVLGAPEEVVAGETFNVGTASMNYTLATVGDVVAERVGGDVVVEHTEFMEDRRNYRVAFDKIEKQVGWTPRYTLESGVDEMIEELRTNAALRDYQQAKFSNLKYLKGHYEAAGMLDAEEPVYQS